MLTPRDAIQRAFTYAQEVLGQAREEILLEEVELLDQPGREYCRITLSFPRRNGWEGGGPGTWGQREFKTFVIDLVSGDVVSMKIRDVAA